MVTTVTDTSRRALACLLAACAALLLMASSAGAASARMDRVERSVLRGLNTLRAQVGLRPLRASRALTRAANVHSRDMLSADFFAHSSSNGQSMISRVQAFRPSSLMGEVLAYLPGPSAGQAETVVEVWRASPPHLAAILTSEFRLAGIARRTGRLGNLRVTVFTADFASAR
jgi:uncharacterized protein YkwD